jgi:predicted nuclease of predicted toxin-antitoxin system
MKFLANENFPKDAVDALRNRGHDVLWIRSDAPGIDDIEVLNRAASENRILLTFDKDFSELAFRYGLPSHCGIILFRISTRNSEYIANVSISVLESRTDWKGNFSVIEESRIRMRPLPKKN